MIRRAIVALAEDGLQIGIKGRRRREVVSVQTNPVLQLQIVTLLVGIAERHSTNELAPAPYSRRQLPAERRRLLRLEIGQRVERERAEGVALLIQAESVAP